ncbi:MAG TPA: putative toxin-antitoxin system toxin component, PIN family [Burkholderiaceae bacterium]|jgi:putative PIN family toxin of toxin-antitoxin system
MNSGKSPPLLVLDTNVCLDLFFFRDPRWLQLLEALQSGAVRAITRDDCRAEWQIVLTYPQLGLQDDDRQRCMVQFDTLITCVAKPETAIRRPLLPICSDGDDQKFLELAYDAKVDALITKDKALLKLSRKAAKHGLFAIVSPESWHQHWLQGSMQSVVA